MKFALEHRDTSTEARAGTIATDRGSIPTPVFMPVGTSGALKGLRTSDLVRLDLPIVLANTYHLFLRPGTDVISSLGGLHAMMTWDRPILTDSGGFQVFSLEELRTIDDDGVEFSSHLDGSRHRFTPENVIETQRIIGSDIAMILDECPPARADRDHHARAMRRSLAWAERAAVHHTAVSHRYGKSQALFGIAQGGTDRELRGESVDGLREIGFDGYAIGGLAVGESNEEMYETIAFTTPMMPEGAPRYLMGVGTPVDLLEAVRRGIDMFDCVMPTRNARKGTLFTSRGRINLRNARWKEDREPIDPDCSCETCQTYPRGYLRHLITLGELTGQVLATIHNVHFYVDLMRRARRAILEDCFEEFCREQIPLLSSRV